MQMITFWDLITSPNIKKICIPTIQRDYALGRRDRAFNRQNFLTALKSAICTNEELPLDFVYGVDNETMFIPLDGQQRLTTLWLLHWYISYKAGILSNSDIKEPLLKFSYETRISSSDFCKSLCELAPNVENKPLRDWITQQTWFFHQYRQDPTIMGMINMIAGTDLMDKDNDIIDGLAEIFIDDKCDYKSMWNRLTTTKCIKFNKLQVSLNDSDELYVKMNARGKQLTDFENFKTELVQYVKKQNFLNDEETLSFAAKLDVDWTDIFWNNKWEDKKTNDVSIDEIYFTFINRFVRMEYIKKYGEKKQDNKVDYLKQITTPFTSFKPYEVSLDKKSILDFIKIMDNLRGATIDTESSWKENFAFIPCYQNNKKNEITKITNTQTLVAYGFMQYLLYGEYDENSFSEWKRVLWNICENRVDKSNFKPTISEIDLLSPYSHNIIDFLSQDKEIEFEQNKKQLLEEQRKARHLKDYPMIQDMEGYLFFKGAIRFLYTGEDGGEDWKSFVAKSINIKDLVPKEARHTISLFVDYLSEQALCDIYSYNWVSNRDEYLRGILLYDIVQPYLHNFLLKNVEEKYTLTRLHEDIKDLCETAFGGLGYLRTNWNDSKYVWTNYERGSKYHGWCSYVVGNESYMQISKIIDTSDSFEVRDNQKNRRIGDHIQATYLHFKYEGHFFTLFGNNTICLYAENWEGKMPNPNDEKGFYFAVPNIETEQNLIEQIRAMLSTYDDQKTTI